MELTKKNLDFRCKEKLLPHYFGRMVYAFDIVNYDVMEKKLYEEKANKPFRILFYGGSDVKHLLRTVSANPNLAYEFHLVDSNPQIQVKGNQDFRWVVTGSTIPPWFFMFGLPFNV